MRTSYNIYSFLYLTETIAKRNGVIQKRVNSIKQYNYALVDKGEETVVTEIPGHH